MKDLPKFRVFLVKDGYQFGLFFRKTHSSGHIESAYFYLDNKEGLQPTEEILKACENQWVKLESTRFHDKFFKEIKAYAEAAHQSGKMNAPLPLSEAYPESENFGDIINRVFERGDKKLLKFLESSQIFKRKILQKIFSCDEVIGKAEEFGVFSAHHIFPEDNCRCLRPIQKVLEIGKPGMPVWFRRQGPIAIDFDNNMVYRRQKRLDDLKSMVMNHPVSMLVGISATGKTVLVLNLAYDLFKAGEYRIYFFDCAQKRSFDQSDLVQDIRSVRGIYILENVHLEPHKFQWVHSEFKHDSERHILFTSRPSDESTQDVFSDDLSKIKNICLKPFDNVDEFIHFFALNHNTSIFTPDVCKNIKEISQNNLWLLSYALQSCLISNDKGNLKDWIKAGIEKDLMNLESINPEFPEILVALSPLYKHEVPTVENYLCDNLKFKKQVLNDLNQMGEITKQKDNEGYVFYGLTHLALAEAYWEYGKTYKYSKKLPQYEDFIYDYATSNTANASAAIFSTNKEVANRLLNRIDKEGKTKNILTYEVSLRSIITWMEYCSSDISSSDDLLKLIATKIDNINDLDLVEYFFSCLCHFDNNVCKNIVHFLNLDLLASKINDNPISPDLILSVKMNTNSENVAEELCEKLDLDKICNNIKTEKDVELIYRFISIMIFTNEIVAKKLWSKLDMIKLGSRLIHTCNLNEIRHCFELFYLYCPKYCLKLWNTLDYKKLINKVVECNNPEESLSFIIVMYVCMPNTGEELCNDKQILSFVSNSQCVPVTDATTFSEYIHNCVSYMLSFHSQLKETFEYVANMYYENAKAIRWCWRENEREFPK